MQHRVWLICFYLFSTVIFAQTLTKEQIPESLKPWIPWVTEEHPERHCPFLYNDSRQRYCDWPTAMQMALTYENGLFNMQGKVYQDSWVSLPGGRSSWPQNVMLNQHPALVMDKDGIPSIKILADSIPVNYQIKGEFSWRRIPDTLPMPMNIGLINLSINGNKIAAPNFDGGMLWIKDSERQHNKPENIQNSLNLKVFRLFTDRVPLQVVTRLVLEVAGEQREVKFAHPMLANFLPFKLDSELPSRLENDGQLLVQVRPGHWQIDISARSVKDLLSIAYPVGGENWPEQEIWMFDAQEEERIVEVEQVSAIDTSQEDVPSEWKRLPAYRITQGQAMGLKLIQGGDLDPSDNELSIYRKLWLDFDGGGYTVSDTMIGQMSRDWRLNALPDMQLGKVSFYFGTFFRKQGEDLLITRTFNNQHGLEVRSGLLSLTADSRMVGNIAALSAVGWAQDFQLVITELNLPPGWQLLAASGVDHVQDSWLSHWSLLDVFLVLLAAFIVSKLWNRYWGLFALVTLILIWQEPDVPRWIWLNLLAVTALIHYLPNDKLLNLSKLAKAYRMLAWLVLLFFSVPFMAGQILHGFYPQLESDRIGGVNRLGTGVASTQPVASMAKGAAKAKSNTSEKSNEWARSFGEEFTQKFIDQEEKINTMFPMRMMKGDIKPSLKETIAKLEHADPNAKVQTGPGLPDWEWHKIRLSWDGKVTSQQTLHLWYLSPAMTMVLSVLRVVFITVLALLMIGIDVTRINFRKFHAAPMALLALCLLPLSFAAPTKAYAEYPDKALLDELKSRLQIDEKLDCLPACADISYMTLRINSQQIEIVLQIHAGASVVLPLPADNSQWFPNQVLDNGEAATELYRKNDNLWLHVSPGIHHVTLLGNVPLSSQFTLPLPLQPKQVTLNASGWEVAGIQENGEPDEQLQFSRTGQVKDANNKITIEPGTLPPLIQVERSLQLGLDWRLYTRVSRLSPTGTAIVLNVGLLPGEAVTTEGIHVKKGAVAVNMSAHDTEIEWLSTLAKTPTLTWVAPNTEQWTENWKIKTGAIWHVENDGIPPIKKFHGLEWTQEWHPWPGEKISLHITRPEAVSGQTLTIDHSELSVKQQQRIQEVTLNLGLRSSQSGQHTLVLPDTAELQSVRINERAMPIRLQDHTLILPIALGEQRVSVHWQQQQPMTALIHTPVIDLGVPSVNSRLNIALGPERWLLWLQGPRLGPVLLFWGVVCVLALMAVGLSQSKLTPLKHWQWFLLLLGLSQLSMMFLGGVVIVWLMLLGWRQQQSADSLAFNALQILLGCLTLASLGVLIVAIVQGLLNPPDMLISGNDSNALDLHWYQDRSAAQLPVASVISVPVSVYRILMLAWSLWLVASLTMWLSWVRGCFTSNGLWYKSGNIKAKD